MWSSGGTLRLPLIGRAGEMAHLIDALDSARDGHGRLIFLAGEPGAGKTRLAQEFAVHAEREGASIVWGRCLEDQGAPPFWPWRQALRALFEQLAPQTLHAAVGDAAGALVTIAPELSASLPESRAPLVLQDASQQRFQTFDAVTQFLVRTGRTLRLVILLEDLHWADGATLALLSHISAELASLSILIVCTVRDTDIEPSHPILRLMGNAARSGAGERVDLPGLSGEEIAHIAALVTGQTLPPDAAVALAERTGGNPLFVTELLRLRLGGGEGRVERAVRPGDNGLPDTVRGVIHRRVGVLGEGCAMVLAIAVVIGQEFDVATLQRMWEGTSDSLFASLEAAEAARLIAPVPDVLGGYQFTHALIREVLYDGMSLARRISLHQQAALILEHGWSSSIDRHLSELAAHFAQAASAGSAGKAVTYARRAAAQAEARPPGRKRPACTRSRSRHSTWTPPPTLMIAPTCCCCSAPPPPAPGTLRRQRGRTNRR